MRKTDYKSVKKITRTCPHCKKEIAFSGTKIQGEIDDVKAQMASLQMRKKDYLAKTGRKTDGYYKGMKAQEQRLQNRLQQLNENMRNLRAIMETEKFEALKQKLYQKYGREEIIALLEECEEEMQGSTRETTRYTHFENAGRATTGKRFT